METRKATSKSFSPEVRSRAVGMVQEHQGEHASQGAAISSIASKIGCTGETLRLWVRRTEGDQGERAGLTTDERENWPREFGQRHEWIFCLTAARVLAATQERR